MQNIEVYAQSGAFTYELRPIEADAMAQLRKRRIQGFPTLFCEDPFAVWPEPNKGVTVSINVICYDMKTVDELFRRASRATFDGSGP